jgi:PIN domain nuclease of toxin-antitoxin system
MADAVTDTHGLIWYLEDSPRLSSAAREKFAACDPEMP